VDEIFITPPNKVTIVTNTSSFIQAIDLINVIDAIHAIVTVTVVAI
jgi:hypothetical protein